MSTKRVAALRALRKLRRDGGIDADTHAVFFGVGQRLFDLLVDRLPAIDALAPVGDGRLRSGHLLVVLVAVLVDEDFDAPHACFGLRQHGVRFEVGDALLELGDLLEQFLPLGVGRLCSGRGIERDVELHVLVGGDRHTLPPERGQAGGDDGDVVAADRQRAERIGALRVGHGLEPRAGRRVDGRHRGIGDGRVVRTADRPADAAAVIHVRHVHRRLAAGA